MSSPAAEYSELKWRCRRGMLELDILLNDYLDRHYATMSHEQGALFSEVLDYPDQVLLDLLLGNMQSSDVRVNSMITEIQKINQP
ncbi:MAG: succinate dehydrogenase assembly factor 2 [Gammaproteobacteria bacterium]|nr:succinate dehydrogenase assembly factor 2 [Gammaproteobacteria bacterium]NNL06086.1 succinate dehydrogenase assembly factor 2 [Gammaproteobacteria bacterium]